jgi:hypothetical protein
MSHMLLFLCKILVKFENMTSKKGNVHLLVDGGSISELTTFLFPIFG